MQIGQVAGGGGGAGSVVSTKQSQRASAASVWDGLPERVAQRFAASTATGRSIAEAPEPADGRAVQEAVQEYDGMLRVPPVVIGDGFPFGSSETMPA